MALIYKDFAKAFAGIDDEIEGTRAVRLPGARMGAQIGILYGSNVGHYLRWTKAGIAMKQDKGEIAHDYTRAPITTGSYRQAQKNLRAWFGPAGGHTITSNRPSGEGRWSQFRPRLGIVPPFTPDPA